MKHNIVVNVVGLAGTGKTTVVAVLEKALKEAGFSDVNVNMLESYDIEEVLSKTRIDNMSQHVAVTINEINSGRCGLDRLRK
jgi:adenylate kinase